MIVPLEEQYLHRTSDLVLVSYYILDYIDHLIDKSLSVTCYGGKR